MNQDCVIPVDTPSQSTNDDIMIERELPNEYEKVDTKFCCITAGVCMFIGGIPLLLSYIFYLSS